MRRRANAVLTAVAIAAGSVMFSAPIASASVYCDNSGYTVTNEPMERCTSLSNGVLVVHQSSSGVVSTTYDKQGGSTISAQLGYSRSGTSHYASAISISSGQTKSATWSLSASAYCTNTIGLLKYSGGSYQTPTSHC
ncbi:hypothetical protein Shyhy01_74130 [Streptomyces hygroscopicus subsp. hygroscopicus]|uniref:hypothetical protein n=1 Tax=Streptomyces sp. KHY 26 TaxID=3097359 RepID=UPI0024A0CFA9|nr:hypothetical protein [Streptomyces hygroscopicus]GLX54464.1 hypothetical protein Shyhy01_74130 [Streptomyces hygroscopicus subsp. hygroscopicus]